MFSSDQHDKLELIIEISLSINTLFEVKKKTKINLQHSLDILILLKSRLKSFIWLKQHMVLQFIKIDDDYINQFLLFKKFNSTQYRFFSTNYKYKKKNRNL